MNNRELKFDNIRLVLMLLVCIGHVIWFFRERFGLSFRFVWVCLRAFTMPCFMLISGYFYKDRSISYVVRKFIWPIILFGFLNSVMAYFFCNDSFTWRNAILRYGGLMWYLFALATYYILAHFIKNKNLWFLSVIVCVGFDFWSPKLISESHVVRIVNFAPFFFVGRCLSQDRVMFSNILRHMSGVWVFCIEFAIFCLLAYLSDSFFGQIGYCNVNGTAMKLLSMTLALLMSLSIIQTVPSREFWWTKYGRNTLTVLLLQMVVIYPCVWAIKLSDIILTKIMMVVLMVVLLLVLFSNMASKINEKMLVKA